MFFVQVFDPQFIDGEKVLIEDIIIRLGFIRGVVVLGDRGRSFVD